MSRSLRRVPMLIAAASLTLAFASPAAGQAAPADSAHQQAVYEMLQTMHVGETIVSMIEAAMQDSTDPDAVPPEFREAFVIKARERLPELVRMFVPMYAAQLSAADVREITRFYETPAGQHLLAVKQEGDPAFQKAAERWGMKVMGEVILEMSE